MHNSALKVIARFSSFVGLAFVLVCIQSFVMLVPQLRNGKGYTFVPKLFYGFICRGMGIRVETRGEICKKSPCLFVSNHVSYLDILILGSKIPGSFVAKSDIAKWPVIGVISGLAKTVFLDRKSINIQKHANDMLLRLQHKDNLILFPEGTSSDGNRVLQFKSALFNITQPKVDGEEVWVQPVTLAFAKLDGLPLGRHLRPMFAWTGDEDMLSHAWNMAGLGQLDIVIQFHEPVQFSQFGSRKALAEHCGNQVADSLSEILSDLEPQPSRLEKIKQNLKLKHV